jgi:hypothetical protein
MKKHLFLTLFAVMGAMNMAQAQTFTQVFDSVFMHISRADATTGILYNRVLSFSGLPRFTRSDTANATIFKQAFQELYEAAFIPAVRLPFEADGLTATAGYPPNKVDIGMLHYKYNVLNDSVTEQKLYFDADSLLRENSAVTASLYLEQTAFLASPLKDCFQTPTVIFCFKNLLRFDNTGNPTVQLQVDFGAGGNEFQINPSSNRNFFLLIYSDIEMNGKIMQKSGVSI